MATRPKAASLPPGKFEHRTQTGPDGLLYCTACDQSPAPAEKPPTPPSMAAKHVPLYRRASDSRSRRSASEEAHRTLALDDRLFCLVCDGNGGIALQPAFASVKGKGPYRRAASEDRLLDFAPVAAPAASALSPDSGFGSPGNDARRRAFLSLDQEQTTLAILSVRIYSV